MAFIGIDRGIVDHWIYQDAEYFKVWVEMLLRARFSHEPEKKLIEGHLVTIEFGQFIFGRISWSDRLKISERRLRTLMDKLIADDMIRLVKRSPKFSVFCVTNYAKYRPANDQQETQSDQGISGGGDHQSDQQTTSECPANDQQATTQEQGSNKVNKGNKDSNKKIYAEKVTLTEDEYEKLIDKYGSEDLTKAAIEKLSNYKCSKRTKYTSDYHVLIGWVYDDFVKRKLIVLNGGQRNERSGNGDLGYAVGHSEPDWDKFVRK